MSSLTPLSLQLSVTNTSHPTTDAYFSSNNRLFLTLSKSKAMRSLFHKIRDSGSFGTISDALIYLTSPLLLLSQGRRGISFALNFPYISSLALPLRYGVSHSSQVVDLFLSRTHSSRASFPPTEPCKNTLVTFVHGGAWGSGDKLMYRGVAATFLERGFDVAIVGYRVFPVGDTWDQAEDVARALACLEKWGNDNDRSWAKVCLSAHSSGGHISLLSTLLHSTSFVTHLVLLSGVYALDVHWDYEARRGVGEVSPLKSAAGCTRDGMEAASIRSHLDPAPEHFPRTLMYHGLHDLAVPFLQTVQCAALLREHGLSVETIHDGGDHFAPVLEMVFGGKEGGTLAAVLEFLEREGEGGGERGEEEETRFAVASKL